MAKKWYVVWTGHTPGVYDNWDECRAQTEEFNKARYKSFATESDALRAYEDGADEFYRRAYGSTGTHGSDKHPDIETLPRTSPIWESLSVDAACSGNPGPMEYRGVLTASKAEVFRVGPLEGGTNNIGEFLAIVHALALLEKMKRPHYPIYSDSMTAISWVRKKKCKTLLARTDKNAAIFDLIERAEHWLSTHRITNPIYKWNTVDWMEIPADFGRK